MGNYVKRASIFTQLCAAVSMPRLRFLSFLGMCSCLQRCAVSIGLYRENAIAIESEARDPFGGNVYYATMQITFPIPEFARKERKAYRPLSRRLDRCDRVIQNESRDPFGGNVYYVTMQITFLTRKFRNGERNLHCDVVHITTKWVSSLTLDYNGVFAIKAYGVLNNWRRCMF